MNFVGSREEDALVLELSKSDRDNDLIDSLVQNDTISWPYFLETISRHLIAPVILNRLLSYTVPESQKKQLRESARRAIIGVAFGHKVFKSELQRILQALKDSGIDSILMKGLSLDVADLRYIGDIDILVKSDSLKKAMVSLRDIDYKYNPSSLARYLKRKEKHDIELQLAWNNHYQFINKNVGVILEIHTNLFQKDRFYVENLASVFDNINLFWEERVYSQKLSCHVFSPEHSLFLICLHTAIKRSPANNQFVLRQLMDIDNLIAGGINWPKFISLSVDLGVPAFCYFSLLLSRRLLNAIVPDDVLSTLQRQCSSWQLFLTRIHLKCIASLTDSPQFYSKLYRILKPFVFGNSWKDRVKWIFLLPLLFPPKERMAQLFNLKPSSPLVYLAYLVNPLRCAYLALRAIFYS